MIKISLLSDTHSYMDAQILKLLEGSDEIWHAGDIGDYRVAQQLEAVAPLRAVFGNIDDHSLRRSFPEHQRFSLENCRVWMTHIGGYPGRYDRRVQAEIKHNPPDIFISGHSHILKVMRDPALNLLHLNPGAIGKHGLHQVRSMLRFHLDQGRLRDLEVVELKR